MKRYRKNAKLAMTVALATSLVTCSTSNVFAQELSESNSESTPIDAIENEKDSIEDAIEIPSEDRGRKEEIEDTEEPPLESAENFEYVARATNSVEINENKFPDQEFREYIAATFDKDSDGVLSVDEINKVTSIVIAKRIEIKSIEGIEYFPNLSSLRIGETGITTLDISQNTELTQLYCNDTGITTLDVSQNTKLTDLRCYKTEITNLDISNNRALTSLQCQNTGITSLDLSQNSALTSLRCNNTGITTLDISNNLALADLNCSNTQITSLDVSKNIALTELNCYSNSQLVTLQLDGAIALAKLQCQSTGITSLDVSNNPALTSLNCNNTSKLTSLDVSSNPALKELICYNNSKLVALQLNGANALESLQCQNTGITSLDVSNNPALTYLRCDNTKITNLNVNNPALIELNCSNTPIATLDVSNNTNLEILTCSNISNVSSLDVSKNIALKKLNCYNNPQLTSLHVDGAVALETLQCQNTGISNLDVSKNLALVSLNCNNTPNITTLDVRKNSALKELICYNNPQLTSLDVNGATVLETLQCQNTGITSLDVSNNPALQTLSCNNTNLAWLNIGNNSNLNCNKSDSIIDLGKIDLEFNIQDKFPGIELNKITNISGATLDKTTGIVSGYKNEVPIRYTYDCGTSQANQEVLNVTLNFIRPKEESNIIINDDLNKVYDGQAVEEPKDVVTTGSTGATSFEWYTVDGTKLDSAPVNAGSYKVKAILVGDANYNSTEIEKEFMISQANSTIIINDDLNKVYDGQAIENPKDIVTTGSAGIVRFEWYTADGTKLQGAPVNVGSYKVKAILEADTNYASAEVEKVFDITKANSTIIINGDLNKVYDGQAVMQPNIIQTGSQSAPTYEWYVKNEGVTKTDPWTRLSEAPTEVGNYKLVVRVAEDMNYYGATAEIEFSIKEAQQETTPGDSDNGGANTSLGNRVEGVQTGDHTQVGLWTILLGLCSGLMMFFTKKKYKEER